MAVSADKHRMVRTAHPTVDAAMLAVGCAVRTMALEYVHRDWVQMIASLLAE